MDNIFVTKSSMPSFEEYTNEIKDIWCSCLMTNMGKHHKELEEKLKLYLNVENISLFVNGHSALELTLQAMNLKGEVITTPFTFASTTHAIVRNGLTPVFCDIKRKDFTIDTLKIEKLITSKTSAILPVHVYGNICDVEEIERISEKYNLKVIYDAAHAFGEKYKGIDVGNFGDVSVFSFHATKVFNTIEGGAAVFKDINIGKQLYKLKNFGIKSAEVVDGIGANAKMNEFQAAMGVCNLRHIEKYIEGRKNVAQRYTSNLQKTKGLIVPQPQKNVVSNYPYFPVIIVKEDFGKSRDDVYDILLKNNIHPRKYFYPLTSDFECYEDTFDSNLTPIALAASKEVITLPIYPDLPLEQVDRICDVLLKA